jgi:hypothetical protein
MGKIFEETGLALRKKIFGKRNDFPTPENAETIRGNLEQSPQHFG